MPPSPPRGIRQGERIMSDILHITSGDCAGAILTKFGIPGLNGYEALI